MLKVIFGHNLTNLFINQKIGPISLNNLVTNFEASGQSGYQSSLHQDWIDWWNKYQLDHQPKLTLNCDDYFYAILITLTTILVIYEDLRKYFQHQNPATLNTKIIQSQLKIFLPFSPAPTHNSSRDWNKLLTLVKNNYLRKPDLSEIKNLDDVSNYLDEVWTIIENESFLKPVISYEIMRKSQTPFFHQEQNIFADHPPFQALFLLFAKPKIFTFAQEGQRLIPFTTFQKQIASLKNNPLLITTLEKNIEQWICEWNYDYATFLNDELSFFIIKNENPMIKTDHGFISSDINFNLYINYCWSIIYSQSRWWKMWSIATDFNLHRHQIPAQMRQYLYQLNNLRYDWHDDFYGMKEIKKIVKQVNKHNGVENSLAEISSKISRYDRIFAKNKERSNMSYALIAASFFGILDFFTTVFSILTVETGKHPIPTASLTIIIIGCILFFFMICSIGIIVYRFYFQPKILIKRQEN